MNQTGTCYRALPDVGFCGQSTRRRLFHSPQMSWTEKSNKEKEAWGTFFRAASFSQLAVQCHTLHRWSPRSLQPCLDFPEDEERHGSRPCVPVRGSGNAPFPSRRDEGPEERAGSRRRPQPAAPVRDTADFRWRSAKAGKAKCLCVFELQIHGGFLFFLTTVKSHPDLVGTKLNR